MNCAKCGELMDQTDKNTFSGREIREYACRRCGHTDWEDCGIALWQVLHDAYEESKAEGAAQTLASDVAAQPEPPKPEPNPQGPIWRHIIALFRKGRA